MAKLLNKYIDDNWNGEYKYMNNIELGKYVFFSKSDSVDRIKYYKLQAAIIDKLNTNGYAFVFDEPGAGKTIQGIYAIWNVLANKKYDEKSNVLIITPNEPLAIKWKREIKDFLKIDFDLVTNTIKNENSKFNNNDNNLHITYNGMNYKNLGITKLTNYDEKYIYPSKWDLIILDEVHDYFENYLAALYSEVVDLKTKYYVNRLAWHQGKQILVLTATPISYKRKDRLAKIKEVPKKLSMDKESLCIPKISVNDFLEFNNTSPYQRYFKETILEKESARNRQVEFLEYDVSIRMKELWSKISGTYHQHCYGNIYLLLEYIKRMNKNMLTGREENILKIFSKTSHYSLEDIEKLKMFDPKIKLFIDYIVSIRGNLRVLIFIKQKATRRFLEKTLQVYDIKVFSMDSELTSQARTECVDKFNDYKGDKVLISSWALGNYGLNMHGADTVMCYECSSSVNEIEQGFGRIDRINKGYDNLKLILFKTNDSYYYYDNYIISTIYSRLFAHLTSIPSKNILFTSDYINEYVSSIRHKKRNYNKLKEYLQDKISEDATTHKSNLEKFCIQEELEYESFVYELEIYQDDVKYKKIKEITSTYTKLDNDISNFIKVAKNSGCTGKSVSDMLGRAIYYYEDSVLKITSIEKLLDKAGNYIFNEHAGFDEGINLLLSKDICHIKHDVQSTDLLNAVLQEAILKKIDDHEKTGIESMGFDILYNEVIYNFKVGYDNVKEEVVIEYFNNNANGLMEEPRWKQTRGKHIFLEDCIDLLNSNLCIACDEKEFFMSPGELIYDDGEYIEFERGLSLDSYRDMVESFLYRIIRFDHGDISEDEMFHITDEYINNPNT